jgi:protein-disulfide isomerase
MRISSRSLGARRAHRRHALRSLGAAALLLAVPAACHSSGDGKAGGTPSASAAPTSAGGETVGARAGSMPADSVAQRLAADSGRILGAPGAKVWMIIASDFQCPYCKMWHDQTYAALRKDYVDAGRIRMAYVNFPLDMHVQARPAAEAAMCASAQHKFWEYHTALFQSQDAWAKAGDQSAKFDSLAGVVGVDVPRFHACTQSHVMRAVVEADQFRMQRTGVGSTPTFFIGNEKVEGAQPLPVFREAVDSALAHSAR